MYLNVNALGFFLHSIERKETMTVDELWELVCKVEDQNKNYPSMSADAIADEVNELAGGKQK